MGELVQLKLKKQIQWESSLMFKKINPFPLPHIFLASSEPAAAAAA